MSACVVLHKFCEMHRVACQEHQEDMLEPPEAGSEQRDVPALSPAEHIREALVAHTQTMQSRPTWDWGKKTKIAHTHTFISSAEHPSLICYNFRWFELLNELFCLKNIQEMWKIMAHFSVRSGLNQVLSHWHSQVHHTDRFDSRLTSWWLFSLTGELEGNVPNTRLQNLDHAVPEGDIMSHILMEVLSL